MVHPHSYRTDPSETTTANAVYGEDYVATMSNKIKIQPDLLKILQHIDSNVPKFERNLSKAISIKSVTSNKNYKDEVKKMTKYLEDWLIKLEVKYEVFNIGSTIVNGKKIKLPPVILASTGHDPKKKTLGAYAHVDVTDPKNEKWDTDPWTLVVKDSYYTGKGVACGKGPLLSWFHVLQAFKHQKIPLPVNVRFCIEMMNHQHSLGFSAFVATKKQDFFNQIDCVAEVSGEWLGPKVPSLIYGTVGDLHMEITVEGNSKDEIRNDMKKVVETIVDENQTIIIPHYHDMVEQITPDEERVYERLQEFDPEPMRASLPPHKRHWGQVQLLMSFWRLPSIFVDKIEECICQNKQKQMIRREFLLKIVPRQIVEKTLESIYEHVNRVIKEKKIQNKVNVKLLRATRPWLENYNSYNIQCARRAIIQIYKQEPNLIREDTGRETAAIFYSVLEKNLVVIPMCPKDSNPGKGNETIFSRCYYEGTKLLAAYMFQLAKPKF